ncbi:hypothetical protein IWQ60_003840 [Tieghemiomyces parasiticus]|uniref:Uncharacterized protein n=1 Tax=Tieghemiomyces parasiticus TaxID=78921 RepID=A0A9W8AA23_9FUNG|nr:hypothetical protein IWQ60_003840 [Tieghemiomyces parasiticus]
MVKSAVHMGYRGLRIFLYVFATLLNIVVLVLSAITVNSARRHSNLYAKGPQAWALFMSCLTLLTLLGLGFLNTIRKWKRNRSSATTVQHGTKWLEPLIFFLLTILWATATISVATQTSLLSCHLARCKTARGVAVFCLFMSMITSYLAAMTLFGNYSHLFSDPHNTTAPHTTTGTHIGPHSGGGVGTAAFGSGAAAGGAAGAAGESNYHHQPQYTDKMAGAPGGAAGAPMANDMNSSANQYGAGGAYGTESAQYGAGPAGNLSPAAQPNASAGYDGYNASHPVVDGTQVVPAMPEHRV